MFKFVLINWSGFFSQIKDTVCIEMQPSTNNIKLRNTKIPNHTQIGLMYMDL